MDKHNISFNEQEAIKSIPKKGHFLGIYMALFSAGSNHICHLAAFV